jgi:hypothetical protein
VVGGEPIVVEGVGAVGPFGVDTPETVDSRAPSKCTRRMAQGKVVRVKFGSYGRRSTDRPPEK